MNKEIILYTDTKQIQKDIKALKTAVKLLNDNYSLISHFTLDEVKDLIKMANNNVKIYSFFQNRIMKRFYRDNGLKEEYINNTLYEPQQHTKYRDLTIRTKEYQLTPKLFVDVKDTLKSAFLIDFITYNPITHYGISKTAETAINERYTYKAHNKQQEDKGSVLKQVIKLLQDNDLTLSDLNYLLSTNDDGRIYIDINSLYHFLC